jgi:hypothetical protein
MFSLLLYILRCRVGQGMADARKTVVGVRESGHAWQPPGKPNMDEGTIHMARGSPPQGSTSNVVG